MNDTDKLRIQFLELDARVGALTIEVIRGRTEIAEKVDRLTELSIALRETVVLLAEGQQILMTKVDGLVANVDELPALIVSQMGDAVREAVREVSTRPPETPT